MTTPKSRLLRHRRRAAFLLPSAFTIGNIFFGFFAMILALRGRFLWAAGCILIAAVVDNLDGRVARMTGQTTPFGAQLDSMADMVTFGVATSRFDDLLATGWGGALRAEVEEAHTDPWAAASRLIERLAQQLTDD